jgi:hypothetical protein
MNKEGLKKALKPIIKECIEEALIESNFLENIIKEALQPSNTIVEQTNKYVAPSFDNERKQREMQENRKRMLDAIGKDAYNGVNLFEGTQPLSNREASRSSGATPHGARPLDGIAPNDPGVNLAALGINTGVWKKLAGK